MENRHTKHRSNQTYHHFFNGPSQNKTEHKRGGGKFEEYYENNADDISPDDKAF